MTKNKKLAESGKDVFNQEVISAQKKKNWKSYFKEFFMLFLAIILGFFVDNPSRVRKWSIK